MKLMVAPEYAWLRVLLLGVITAAVARRAPSRTNGALLTGLAALRRFVVQRQPS